MPLTHFDEPCLVFCCCSFCAKHTKWFMNNKHSLTKHFVHSSTQSICCTPFFLFWPSKIGRILLMKRRKQGVIKHYWFIINIKYVVCLFVCSIFACGVLFIWTIFFLFGVECGDDLSIAVFSLFLSSMKRKTKTIGRNCFKLMEMSFKLSVWRGHFLNLIIFGSKRFISIVLPNLFSVLFVSLWGDPPLTFYDKLRKCIEKPIWFAVIWFTKSMRAQFDCLESFLI